MAIKLSRSQKEKQRRKERVGNQTRREQRNAILRKNIRKFDDPLLSVQCYALAEDADISFITTMKQTLCATKSGVGLAAPQIGVTRCAVVLRFDPKKNDIKVMINPEIIAHSTQMETGPEGCLSYPGVAARISRFIEVKIKYEDEARKEHTDTFKGFEARVVQHELDHLINGTCAVGIWYKEHQKKE